MAQAHIEVPDELKDFLTIESCEDFPLDRYLLTPNQKKIAQDILKVRKITSEMRKLNLDYLNATLLYGVAGTGKAQPLKSKVLTPFGFIEMGSVKEGTLVTTPDGLAAKVLSIHPQGKVDIYNVIFDDGTKCQCSQEHLWEVQDEVERHMSGYKSSVLTLKDIMDRMNRSGSRFSVRNIVPPEFRQIEFLDPASRYAADLIQGRASPDERYLMADTRVRRELFERITAMLAPGCDHDRIVINISDSELKDYIAKLARTLGYKATDSSWLTIDRKNNLRYIDRIEYAGADECQCIYIDSPMHLYITDDYIVTHNTTFGRYLACKFNMDFAFLNFANLVGGGVMGETARNISRVFDFMRGQKCIFMLDEIDCICTRRGQEGAATGGELSRITITVMQELDKYKRQKVDTILIAATNRIEDVDLALMSRFAIKQKIVPWNNEQKEVYIRKFMDAINQREETEVKIEYKPENIHEYCTRNSTLQQREIESDIIRCIANWIDSGKTTFYLDHIKEKGSI